MIFPRLRAEPVPVRGDRQAVVRLEGLSKRFVIRGGWMELLRPRRERRYTTAVDRVSFTAGAGEILGLLGANGAGKTTLLRMLSTLVTPDGGGAEVGGYDLVREPDKVRRMVGPVAADERSLDWRLSARENLRFFGALHGLHGVALARRVEHLLVQMELCEAGERLVGTFSSGMKQRLLIARALLARPRVLLLDEPTRSLDPIAARAFRAFLRREIAERHGCTILLATHDPEEALELCDRVAVLDRGRLLALGTPPGLSLEFGRVRYRLWTRTPDHAALRRIPALGWAVVARREGEGDGWTMLEIDVAPGWEPDQLVTSLVMDGCNVGRFEQVQPSLADLIEQVAARRGASIDA